MTLLTFLGCSILFGVIWIFIDDDILSRKGLFIFTALPCFGIWWYLVRQRLQVIRHGWVRNIFYIVGLVTLIFVGASLSKGYRVLNSSVQKVNVLTDENVRDGYFFDVAHLPLNTMMVGTAMESSVVDYSRGDENIRYKGSVTIPIKGLHHACLLLERSEETGYISGSDEKANQVQKKISERLNDDLKYVLSHRVSHLERVLHPSSGNLQAAAYSLEQNDLDEDHCVMLRIPDINEAPSLWSEISVGVYLFLFYLVFSLLVFLFPYLKKGKREDIVAVKEEEKAESLWAQDEVVRFVKAYGPLVLIGASWGVMFLIEVLMSYGVHPYPDVVYRLGGFDTYALDYEPQWWRMLTCGFLHGSIKHLAGNLSVFVVVSYYLCSEMNAFRASAIFLITVVTSSLAVFMFSHGSTIGASGGIMGMAGAYITIEIFRFLKGEGVNKEGLLIVGILTALTLLSSFGFGFSLTGHLGGLAGGFVIESLRMLYGMVKAE